MSLEALIADAKRYAAQVRGKEARYITHLPTWLNAKWWLDDPEARLGACQLVWWERRELEEKASRDMNGECCSSRRMDEMATT